MNNRVVILLCNPGKRRIVKFNCSVHVSYHIVDDLILRKQIFQIRRREAAGKTFFTEHVGDRLRLALL